jgi:predicted Co/Zn/Cd cation transporter (cation efflux family)
MEFVGYLIGFLVVAIAIGAALIMLATKIVGGFAPKFFPTAVVTAIVITIAGAAASWGLSMVLGAGGLSSLLSLVIVFVLYAAIINALVKQPDGNQMGFGKSALVTLVLIIIEVVLAVILVFVFGASMFAMLGGAH